MRPEAYVIAWGVTIGITIVQVAALGPSAGPLWIMGLAVIQAAVAVLVFLGLMEEPKMISALLAMALSVVSILVLALIFSGKILGGHG